MNRGHVLFIDDNEAELRLYKEAFSQAGFPSETITFSDAEAALRFITESRDKLFLIICDIKMPGMSGPELLKKLNEDHELKMQAVPFIFFSNSDADQDIEEAYSLAAQGYFQKPLELDELTDLFRRIIAYWSAARIPRYKHHVDNN
jgi:CheY-like chemotaxis protein